MKDFIDKYEIEDFAYMIDFIEASGMNSWEEGFINTLKENKTLTKNQYEKLEELYANRIL